MLSILKDKKLRLYLLIPVASVLYLLYYAFGPGSKQATAVNLGLNTQLPKASVPSSKESILDKLASYEKARQDSLQRKRDLQRDVSPLAPSLVTAGDTTLTPTFKDEKSDRLLQQLNQLQKTLDDPKPVRHLPVAEPDPQLERLNSMLDKVMQIQHPVATAPVYAPVSNGPVDEVLPADSTSNTIAVSVPQKQLLTAGATIALRLEEDARVGKTTIPRGGLVYGTVSINNDRLQVHINAIRSDRNIYMADLTAYDLDGLPGIHIPDQMSRDVAKQSADQGLTGLNLMTYDPSLGAQAANAGIQTAKSLFGRKVRQVRVTVRAGYQLLLRSSRNNSSSHSTELHGGVQVFSCFRPPGFVPGGPILKEVSMEGMELSLLSIYLQDEVLWFALSAHNGSPITYIPEYTRWFIRDRRVFRRTAVQEMPLTPIYIPPLLPVSGDSTCTSWTGFRPFALTRDKELVIEMGEKNGGRLLQLVLRSKDWKTIKRADNGTEEQ